MDFAEALEADELWGWPVEVLDRLRELREHAWQGRISLPQWRTRDAAERVGRPTVDDQEVDQFRRECVDIWVSQVQTSVSVDIFSRLAGRLTALLHGAPSDEDLSHELAAIGEALADPRCDRLSRGTCWRNCHRIVEWLTRRGSEIDPQTGLPWSYIRQYRFVVDPHLGTVTQYVDDARRLAEWNASPDQRARAKMLREHSDQTRPRALTAEPRRNHLSRLTELLGSASDDEPEMRTLYEDLVRIWNHPGVQRLLVEETLRGWPDQSIENG
jgi:hypothetical protein